MTETNGGAGGTAAVEVGSSTTRRLCASASVIVTCGTGGVGKTSIASALGVEAARLGRRAVVVTIDPARRLADAIGLPGSLGNDPVRVDLAAVGELWVCMLDVRATFDQLVRDTSPSTERADEVLDNSFYRSMSRSLSGTRDYMAAERLYTLANDPRFDLVIVDTPPSRNALDFIESPERLARFLRHPIVRLLIAPGRSGLRIASAAMTPVLRTISAIVGSDALSGAVAFLRAFDGMQDEFLRRALAVTSMLRGEATHFVVVAAPSPDALGEAHHFVAELSRLSIPLRLIVANRMPPRFGETSSGEQRRLALACEGDERAAREVLADLTEDAERAEARVDGFIERSRALFPGVPVARATEMPTDIHDMASVVGLADQLAAPTTPN